MTTDPCPWDRIAELEKKATPGWWGSFGMGLFANQDGTRDVANCVHVASFHYRDSDGRPRTFDLDFCVEIHNALPSMLRDRAALLEVAKAADDLLRTADEASKTGIECACSDSDGHRVTCVYCTARAALSFALKARAL